MKKLLFMLLTFTALQSVAQKTNFNGSYKVNDGKVNWGPAPHFILPKYIKVVQLNDTIIITRTALNKQLEEQPPVADTIAFDGTLFTRNNPSGGKNVSSLKWINDASFVVVKKTMNANGEASSTITETWSLEDGGKTLFINREVDGKIKYTTKAYFDKQ